MLIKYYVLLKISNKNININNHYDVQFSGKKLWNHKEVTRRQILLAKRQQNNTVFLTSCRCEKIRQFHFAIRFLFNMWQKSNLLTRLRSRPQLSYDQTHSNACPCVPRPKLQGLDSISSAT